MSLQRLFQARSLIQKSFLRSTVSLSFSSIQSIASDILPIKLANDETIDKDHPIFASDVLLQKLNEVKNDRMKEVLRFGPTLASDLFPHQKDQVQGLPSVEGEGEQQTEEEILGSDLLLAKIQQAENTRVAEILEQTHPGVLGLASDVLPINTLVQSVQEAQAARIEQKLDDIYAQEMATDVLPLQVLDAEAHLEKHTNLGGDDLLEKLQQVLALRIEEYEGEVENRTPETQAEATVKYAASKLKFGPDIASDVLQRDKKVKIQGNTRPSTSGPILASDILPKEAA